MRIIKGGLLGLTFGLLYAFVSFYLIVPYLKDNIQALLFFGLQGFLFGIAYITIQQLIERIFKNRFNLFVVHPMIGLFSGVISDLLGLIITYYYAVISASAIVSDELKTGLFFALLRNAIGNALLGVVVGAVCAIIIARGQHERSK